MANSTQPGLGELLRHLTELVEGGAEDLYRDRGLDYRPRYTPIMRVLADGEHSVRELTEKLVVTQGAVSQTLRLMASDGLVASRPGADARRSLVALTDRGTALLDDLRPHWQATFEAIRGLENEIGSPLRHVLGSAIEALGRMDLGQRVAASLSRPASEQESPDVSAARSHFQSGGKSYARYRPDYPPALAEALAAVSPGHRLAVDVGCGTGQLSVLLAEHFRQVLAIDVSQDQLAHAVPHPNVVYRHEPAERTSVADRSADLIVAAQSAHWLEPVGFHREIQRIARPRAVVALVSYGVPYLEGAINTPFQRFYWTTLAPFQPEERRHVESGYRDLPFPFEAIQAPELFIRREWSLGELVGYLQTWSAVRRMKAAGKDGLMDGFIDELERWWGKAERRFPVVWPIAIRQGRVD